MFITMSDFVNPSRSGKLFLSASERYGFTSTILQIGGVGVRNNRQRGTWTPKDLGHIVGLNLSSSKMGKEATINLLGLEWRHG